MHTRCIPRLRGIPVGRMCISLVMGTTTAMTITITMLAMASPEAIATAIMSRRAIISQPEPQLRSQPAIMTTMPSISMTTD
jgi:hypothetical protein